MNDPAPTPDYTRPSLTLATGYTWATRRVKLTLHSHGAREVFDLLHERGDGDDVLGEGRAVRVGLLDQVEEARVVEQQLGVSTCLRMSMPSLRLAKLFITSRLIASMPARHVSWKERSKCSIAPG